MQLASLLPRKLQILESLESSYKERLQAIAKRYQAEEILWLGSSVDLASAAFTEVECIKNQQIDQMLGREFSALFYDSREGFHPDAFAAALGTLKGGGTLFLVVPNWLKWSEFNDPDKERLSSYPLSASDVSNHFISRLQQIFNTSGLITSSLSDDVPLLENVATSFILNSEQLAAVVAVEKVCFGHAKRPLVLTADRGRGKSTVLGQAIANLLQQGKKLALLAPKRTAVAAVYAQLHRVLPDAKLHADEVYFQQASLKFYFPDDFLQKIISADLVLIDEAAAIPLDVLQQIMANHNRLVFSTTLHGYEGTGSGFELRFSRMLDKKMPQWKKQNITKPVRWIENDPLEKLLDKALLLNLDVDTAADITGEVKYRHLAQSELIEDESLLAQLYRLLLTAHYQTRPSDLRQLLDAQDLNIVVAEIQTSSVVKIVGVALLISEGGFDEAMAEQVWLGKRRPKGHMLLQSLSCHSGYREATLLSTLRVMRIAVQPEMQRQGIATELLMFVKGFAGKEKIDCLGVSFAFDAAVFPLWDKQGFKSLRVSYKRDACSGQHSLQMLSPLSKKAGVFVDFSAGRFQQQLPLQLANGLRDLEPPLVSLLMKGRDCCDMVLSTQDRADLNALASGRRQWNEMASLWLWLCHALSTPDEYALSELERDLLVTLVLQHKEISWVQRMYGVNGKKEISQLIKNAIASHAEKLLDPVE